MTGEVHPGLGVWPDAEDVVMALLDRLAATAVDTPADLDDRVPLIQVRRIGGVDDGISDRPLIEITVYGATYRQARHMAEQCRQIVLAAGNTQVHTPEHPGGVLIDKAETAAPPQQVSYDNPDIRRKTATYRFVWRRPR